MTWDAEVLNAARHWGAFYGIVIDPALVHGIIERESGHGRAPNYVRNNGIVPEPNGHHSFGPMQVYDDTVRTVLHLPFPGSDLASHPALGIWYGVKVLASLLKKYRGDVASAIASYNAGSPRRTAQGRFINQPYVDAVTGFWNRYKGAVVVSIVPVLMLAGIVLLLRARRRRAA